jgi:hypothetical protein
VVYALKIGDEIWVVHSFQKKSKTGIKTPKAFTLIAQRYERRSVMITSNLVFSEWERIFKEPMATAAAISVWFTTPPSLSSTLPAIAGTPAHPRVSDPPAEGTRANKPARSKDDPGD